MENCSVFREDRSIIVTLTAAHIGILLAAGTVAGFAGGMLGIGGGVIMIPVQHMVFLNAGLPNDVAIKLSLGTSLMVILPTAISGAWRHHRVSAVYWRAAVIMGSVSFAASFLAARIAAGISGEILQRAFGAIVLASAIRMLIAGQSLVMEEPRSNPWLLAAWALPIGLFSGFFGVGGGILTVPIMALALRFKMHHVAATSLAMMIFTSAGGVIGYIVGGIGVPGLPPYSLGYINLPAWFALSVTSIGMVQVGAIASYRLSARYLRYFFVTLVFYMGLKMVGLFDWLGWPI